MLHWTAKVVPTYVRTAARPSKREETNLAYRIIVAHHLMKHLASLKFDGFYD